MKTKPALQQQSSAGKAANITLWILQILLAAAFLFSALAKLSGQPMMVDEFARLGVGQWFRYFTGGVELCAAALLATPSMASLGALLAVCTMLGAITAHLIRLGGSPAAAIVLLLLGLVIAGGRQQRLIRSPEFGRL
jgi:putative oxidoreductase